MGKQPRVSKQKVREIRLKIRAVIEKNRDLKAKVAEQIAAANPQNRQAERQITKRIYSDLIRKNRLLFAEVKKIFELMTP